MDKFWEKFVANNTRKMFLLAELKDTIRIPPETFHLKLIDAVKDEINRKLANKVNIVR